MRQRNWRTWLESFGMSSKSRRRKGPFPLTPRIEEMEPRVTPAAPVAVSLNRLTPGGPSTNANSVTYQLTFDQPVTGVDASDFTVVKTGAVAIGAPQVTPVSDSVYNVTLDSVAGNGTVGVNLVDDGSIKNLSGVRLKAINRSGSFLPSQTFATGQSPFGVGVGDFNHDGKLDVAVNNFGPASNSVSVLLGNGDGSFKAQQTYAASTGPRAIKVGLVNANANPDLVVVSQLPARGSIFLGLSNGGFTAPVLFSVSASPESVAIGDLNGDNITDLAIGFGGGVNILLGTGNVNSFSSSAISLSGEVRDLSIGDLNGDGKPDVVGAGVVLFGNGNGTFKPAQSVAGIGNQVAQIADLNGDGKLDIVSDNKGTVAILGNGDGTFRSPITVSTSTPYSATIGDVTGDGIPDIVTGPMPSLLIGNGDGTFRTPQTFNTGDSAVYTSIGDFNNDGQIDIVATGDHLNYISVLLANGDGSLNGQTYVVDTVTPTAAVTTSTPAATSSTSATFTLSGNDPLSNVSSGINRFEYQVDGAGYLTAANPLNLTGLADGSHLLEVRAVDNAGNVSPTTSFSWLVDTTAPTAAIVPTPPAVTTTAAAFRFEGTDPVSGGVSSGVNHFDYQLDGGSAVSTTSEASFTGLSLGGHTLNVRAVDNAGNVGGFTSFAWTVDTSVPLVQSIARTIPVGAATNGAGVAFTVTFSASVTGVDASDFAVATSGSVIAGAPVVSGSGAVYSITVGGLTGEGTLRLDLVDDDSILTTSGNVPLGGAGATNGDFPGATYVVDRTAPSAAIASGPTSGAPTTSATFTFGGSDPTTNGVSSGVARFEYRLDGGAYATASSPLTLTGLAPIAHVFEVRAVDAAGNVGQPATYSWTIDRSLPAVASIVRTSPSGTATNGSTATYAVTFTKAVTGVDPSSFVATTTGGVASTSLQVAGGGANYVVTVGGISGTGALRLDFVDRATVRDLYGLSLVSPTYALTMKPQSTPLSKGSAAITLPSTDLNGDGTTDLIVGPGINGTGNVVSFYLSNGNGTFLSPTSPAISFSGQGYSGTADFNLDGKPDVLMTSSTSLSTCILLGNGNGTFQAFQTIATAGSAAYGLVTADFNVDGKPDFVVLRDTAIAVSLGNGDGTFLPQTTFANGNSKFAVVADVNADGKPDLLLSSGANFSVLLGNGDGTFKAGTTFAGAISALAAADLNNDGRIDIVTSGTNNRFYAGNGDGTFKTSTTFSSPNASSPLGVADVNGDGKLDLVVGKTSSVGVLLGNGNGTFAAEQTFASLTSPTAFALADFNSDGRIDFAVQSFLSNKFSIILNGIVGDATGPTLTIDQAAPTISIATSTTSVTLDSSASFTLTAVDPVVGGVSSGVDHLEYALDNGAFATTANTVTLQSLANGPHTFYARAVDGVGNVGPAASFSWTVSSTLPLGVLSFTRTAPVGPYSNATSASFVLTFNGNVSGFDPSDLSVVTSGSVGAGVPSIAPISANSYVVTVAGIGGDGTLRVDLVDDDSIVATLDGRPLGGAGAGNGNFSSPSHSVDTTAPTVQITSGPTSLTNSPAATFAVTAIDPTTGAVASGLNHVEYSLDGAAFAAAAFPLTLVNLTSGAHALQVRAVDNVDNVGAPATYNWTVDLASPVLQSINRTTPSATVTNSGSVTYTVTFGKDVAGVSLDDFSVTTTGSLTASVAQLSANSNSSYLVTVGSIVGNGTLTLNLNNDLSIHDAAGNNLLISSSPVTFKTTQTYASGGSHPYSTALGDVNGDGKPDLVVDNTTSGSINLLLGNGNGTFQTQTLLQNLPGPYSINLADVNGDSKADLLVASYIDSVQGAMPLVYLSNGAGFDFSSPKTYATGGIANFIAAGQLNGDSIVDLAVCANNSIVILSGNGNGTFSPTQTLALGASPFAAAIADLNGDGKPDLAAVDRYSAFISVFLSNGNGTFRPQSTFAAEAAWSVKLADFNGDGFLDVASAGGSSSRVNVLLGRGNGTFQTAKTYTIGAAPKSVDVADIDRDGRLDILVSNKNSTSFSVLLGNGNGVFRTQQTFATQSQPAPLIATDLDGDSRIDVIVGNSVSNTLSVFLGNTNSAFAGQSYSIDQNAPTTSITANPAAAIKTTSASFSFASSDAIVGGVASGILRSEYQLDGGSLVTKTSPISLTNLSEASHTIQIHAVDNAGNVGADTTYSWLVDLTAPTVTITDQPPLSSNTSAAHFAFTGNDPGTTPAGVNHFEYSLDGGAFTSTTNGSVDFTNLSNASHSFSVRAVDNAGNVGTTSDAFWLVDSTTPVVVSINRNVPSTALTNASSVSFTVAFSRPVSGIDPTDFVAATTGTLQVGAIGVSGASATYTVTLSGITGDGTVRLDLVDDDTIVATANGLPLNGAGAGNGNFSGPASTIDQTLPTATITANPAALTSSTSATFSWTSADPTAGGISSGLSRVEYKLDGNAVVVSNGPITFTNLTKTAHVFQVQAFDLAGNAGTPAVYNWVVAPLVASINRAATSPTKANSVTFTVTFTESVTGVDVNDFAVAAAGQVAGTVSQVTGSGTTYTVTVNAIAGDGALGLNLVDDDSIRASSGGAALGGVGTGNGNFTGAAYVVDQTGPTPSFVSTPGASSNTNAFSLAANDPTVGGVSSGLNHFEAKVDSGNFATVSATPSFSVTEGSHTVTIRAVDNAGNVGSTISYTWTYDVSAPIVQSIVRAGPNSATNAGSIVFLLNFSEDVTGVSTSNVFVTGTVHATGSVTQVVPITASSYAVTVSGYGGGDGALTVNVRYNSTIRDLAGNSLINNAFKNALTVATGNVDFLATADVNLDGQLDLAVGNRSTGTVKILLGTGNGTFLPPVSTNVGADAITVAIGDLNGDGRPDLAVVNPSANSLGILLGNGDGSFQTRQTYATGPSPQSLALGDVNKDFNLDVVVANRDGDSIGVYLGNGDGSLQAPLLTPTGISPLAVTLVDVSRDGKLDIVVANAYLASTTIGTHLGNGDGTFQSQQTFAVSYGPKNIAVGDLNGDGRPDLAVSDSEYQSISVLLGTTPLNGYFRPQQTVASGIHPIPVAIADVNSDGRADLVTAYGDNNYGVLLNNGGGPPFVLFQPLQTYATSVAVMSLAVADLTGDGVVDLAFGNPSTGIAGLLLSSPAQAYVIDSTLPTASIDVKPPQYSNSAPASFALSGSDPTSHGYASGVDRLEYSLDGAAFLATGSALTLSGLSEDSHVLQVRAVDRAGNVSSVVSYGWIVDRTAPTASISTGPPQFATSGNADFTFAATDPQPAGAISGVNQIEYQLDGGGFVVAANGSVHFTGLADGNHVFQVRATDNAGNVGLASSSWSIDRVAPLVLAIERAAPAAERTSVDRVTFSVFFSEPVLYVDAADFKIVSTGAVTTSAPQITGSGATYLVTLTDVDGAGQLGLNLVDNGTIVDLAGNPLANAFAIADFQSQQTFATSAGSSAAATATADVDGDGVVDLIVTNSSGSVAVMHGNGDGSFQAAATFAIGAMPVAVAAADVTGDGKTDLVAVDRNGAGVGILVGNGDGTFRPLQTVSTGARPTAIAVGDVNGDGKADLAVVNSINNTVAVLLSAGNGSFQPLRTFSTGASPSAVQVADFNRDGKLDLVAANLSGRSISVLLGNGDGSFKPQRQFTVGALPSAIGVADLNFDGVLDVVVANRGNDSVGVLLGNGDGSFKPQQTFATGSLPRGLAVGDVSGDGLADLIVANSGAGTIGVLRGNGDGTFQSQQTFAAGAGAIALGDVDGDGHPDVAAALDTGGAFLLLNQADGNATGQTYQIDPAAPGQFDPGALTPTVTGISASAQVTSVVPFVGPTSGGTTVIINGVNFLGVGGPTGVRFGGVNALSYTVNSATQITAVAPPSSAGLVDVTVTNLAGASNTSSTADDYTYTRPAITSVTVNGGAIVAKDALGKTPTLANQRSVVEQLLVTFNQRVTLDDDAFQIASVAAAGSALGAAPTDATVAVRVTPVADTGTPALGYSQYVLTFAPGAGVNSFDTSTAGRLGKAFTTLQNGQWQLLSSGSKIHAGADVATDRADAFWSLFGAANPGDVRASAGETTVLVDGLALNDVYAAFGSRNDPGSKYNPALDWNLDGFIDGIDLNQTYNNFGSIWRF